jgi:colicin import membrane protein
MAKAPKTISAAEKKIQMAGYKTALSDNKSNIKSISAALKEAEKALAVAKKSADAEVKEAEKAAAAKRKAADAAIAAAQKAHAAAAAKADKHLAAAAKGAEKITGLIAALEAVPLAAPVKAAKAKAAIVPA